MSSLAEASLPDASKVPNDPESDKSTTNQSVVDAAGGDASQEPSPKKAKVENNSNNKTERTRGRNSGVERTKREAEAIMKDLKADDGDSARRRTRSQTRGTPAPSPVHKEERAPKQPRKSREPSEKSPPAPKKTPVKGRARGRPGRKAATASSEENADVEPETVDAEQKIEVKNPLEDDDWGESPEVKAAALTPAPGPKVQENGLSGSDGPEETSSTPATSEPESKADPPVPSEATPAAESTDA